MPIVQADVHAADEADGAVHHHDLAVVAQVHNGEELQLLGNEAGGGNAVRGQGPVGGVLAGTATDLVDQDVHHDAARVCCAEGVDELATDFIGLENINRQGDVGCGGVDGLQHGRENLLGADQRRDVVAAEERRVVHGGFVVEHLALLLGRQAGEGQRGVAELGHVGRAFAAQAARTAFDAVDAENPIEASTQERRDQHQRQPRRGGGLALSQEDVHAHRHGQRQ